MTVAHPSFYIRLIRPGDTDWCKGTIEDIQSGEQGTFRTLEELVVFMKSRLSLEFLEKEQ